MTKEDKQFIIDQLRKDKIIYVTEACATVLVSILVFAFSQAYFQENLRNILSILSLCIGVGYTIFMGVGNFFRLQQIQKLEREL